ncbi:dipeptidyl peptidase 2-like isoform X1 [Ostrea edulis]|uniref:dipeptidyl peptidase 2-like isoform X1 n=1 Tax=Ostrea edulis TaxID=37623 RepID=UPI0024AF4FC4|nr:dipeptidyl peptidase 2-like isoform X1 [Ostrea edulis]
MKGGVIFLSLSLNFLFICGHSVPFKELYIDQYVDHYNLVSFGERTFKERYLVQDKWWKPGVGPIFFYTGNEGPIDTFWDNTGLVFDIAPEFNALIVFAEHRFYGKSLPFGNQSFSHPYIGLLSIEQALGDYAVLLTTLRQELNATSCPVIAFGGSYGGMLSAYIRFKYPNLVAGSIAASAPINLLSADSKRDFFWEDVTKDFNQVTPKCVDRIRRGFIEMDTLSMKPGGLKQLSTTFGLCKPMTSKNDFHHFLGWIRNAFTYLAMMDYPYPTSFMGNLPGYPVKVACGMILNNTNALQGLYQASAIFYNGTARSCFDIWSDFIECADPTGCGLGLDSMAWDFQACTEIHLPAGSNNLTDMFPVLPFTEEIRGQYCLNKWGVAPRDLWSQAQFWAKNIKSASNVVFSNGDLDPWHRGGVTTPPNPSVGVITIKGGAHHLDLRGKNKDDPTSVTAARSQEKAYIRKWISQYRASQ